VKDRFYLFIFFILLALAIWATGYIYAPDLWLLAASWIVAHVYGFVALFFLALHLRDLLKDRKRIQKNFK